MIVKVFSLLLIFFLAGLIQLNCMPERKSIHEIQNKNNQGVKPNTIDIKSDKYYLQSNFELSRESLGFNPYWGAIDKYKNYDYDALTMIAHFSYEMDPSTGLPETIRDWGEIGLIEYAHERDVKVLLTVTNFGSANNDMFLKNLTSRKRFIDTVVSLIEKFDGDGICIDLESIPGDRKQELSNMMQDLSDSLKSRLPSAKLVICLPAVDWRKVFDAIALSKSCDFLMIMGYDYYWSSSKNAGPNAPLEGGNYNVSNSLDYYLSAGVPKEKLLLGVPWYGFDWPTETEEKHSATKASAKAEIYTKMESLAQQHGKRFDDIYKSPWFTYQDGNTWHQGWYDDSLSLSLKYSIVNDLDIGGIGIWALSYSGSVPTMWDCIKAAFSGPESVNYFINSNLIKIYPNPANENISIEISANSNNYFGNNIKIELFDNLGVMKDIIYNGESNLPDFSVSYNCSYLPSGIYYIKLSLNSGAFSLLR